MTLFEQKEAISVVDDTTQSSSVITTTISNRDIENNTNISNTNNNSSSSNQVLESWNIAEQELLQKEQEEMIQQQIHEEQYPSRHCIHRIILLLQCITCIVSSCMFVGQIIGLFIFRSYGPIQYVLHFYVFLLCIVVICIETECLPKQQIQSSFLFRYWIIRGMFYSFIGVIGLEENDAADLFDPNDIIDNFIKIIAWCMIGCGIIYFIFAILCIQYIYTRERKDYDIRCLRAKQIRSNNMNHSIAPPSSSGAATTSSSK